MKIYIAGPMTGIPEYNSPAFHKAAEQLLAEGHEPINPARHGLIDGYEWSDYMRLALRDLADAEVVLMLPGWTGSRGARIEAAIAGHLGIPVRGAIR